MTTPTPAELRDAGLSAAERMRRANEAWSTLAGVPLAPEGALERLADEQGIRPVTDPDELASREPIPDDETEAFEAALRGDREDEPGDEPPPAAPRPQPPFAWVPGLARQPNPMARDQYVRRVGLELAVKHFQDLECEPEEVLATGKVWAEWIRTGL